MSGKGQEWPLAAVCQMTSTTDKAENLKTCSEMISKAVQEGAKMVFLPEGFDYIAHNKEESLELSESLKDMTISKMCKIARQNKIWLSLGGFHQKDPSGRQDFLRNSHVVIDENGNVVDVYDKVHLFDVNLKRGDKTIMIKESSYTRRGDRIAEPLDTPVGKVGLGICYDIRFPEMSRRLRASEAEILTFPSAFTVDTGRAHWEVLLRSRAIENQCYVIAAAQVGQHNLKRASYGHSMIVDPWGSIVASCENNVDVAYARIDLDLLRKVREEMPVTAHLRNDLYGYNRLSGRFIKGGVHDEQFAFATISIKPPQIFYRSLLSVAFVNIKPVFPGHVLVAPVRSVPRMVDLSPSEVADLFCCVQTVQKLIEKCFEAASSTIAIQDGLEAGQTVPHLHVHVIPRKRGDLVCNDDIYVKLEEHDKNDNKKVRTDEEMSSEADMLRIALAVRFPSVI